MQSVRQQMRTWPARNVVEYASPAHAYSRSGPNVGGREKLGQEATPRRRADALRTRWRIVKLVLFRLVLKNLVQRPLRYVLTCIAITFAVALVVAVLIFTGGLRTTFGELAENIESGYDIAVQPRIEFGDGLIAPTISTNHVERITPIDGVLAVQPRVINVGVIAVDGQGVPTFAPAGPNLGSLWDGDAPNTRLFRQSGRPPVGPDEFALDIDAFADGDYELGERYVLQLPTETEPGRTFELTGTFTFANPERNALVGARIVAFDEDTAVELLNDGQGFTDITVIIEQDADQLAVMANIANVVDENIIVRSQEEVLAETQGQFSEFLDIFQTVLLAFAAIISGVSWFLIYNVFSITLGQRIRELGLLRAVGALGSQVTKLMFGEALALGIFSTIVGIPVGLGLAWLLRAALIALGFPDSTGLPLSGFAITAAIFTGIFVTMSASLWPAIQARRVSPLAAMRDGATQTELESVNNRVLGAVLLVVALVPLRFVFQFGWRSTIGVPLVAAALVYFAVRLAWRPAARFVMLPIGIITLLVSLFGSFELGETFGLIGAGSILVLVGSILIMPIFAGHVTTLVGKWPTMVVVGLAGVAFGLGGVVSLGAAGFILVSGVPNTVIDATGTAISPIALVLPLVFIAVMLVITSYGTIRTALGARGLAGRVARSNASRNPQRTATTAAALMIGLALVTAVTVVGDSIKSSVSDALDSSITADWLIRGPQNGPGGTPFSAAAAERVAALDEVESVVPFRVAFPAAWVTSESGELRAEDFIEFLPIVLQLIDDDADLDPQELLALRDELGTDVEVNDAAAVDFANLDRHVDPDFIERDLDLATRDNAVYLVDQVAEEKGLSVGDTFSALFVDLQSEDLVVAGIYENGFVLGNRVITLDLWERHFPTGSDNFLTVVTASGVPEEVARAAIEAELLTDFPILEVSNREEFAAATELQLNQTLATVNVLLGLSGFTAILGILIALALSVFERTREIGLFRAIGTTRSQTRWIIRWEGVIIAIFGGVFGLAAGVGLGVLITAKLPEILVTTISVPIPTLVAYLVFAALTGLAAAVYPAWLAGRMNVLDAISTE